MLNLLLWVINLHTRFIDKLSKLTDKKHYSKYKGIDLVGSNSNGANITYFCWCITDRNEIVGNPVVITASDPNTAALEYYINHVPSAAKASLMATGRTLTTLSRPIQ